MREFGEGFPCRFGRRPAKSASAGRQVQDEESEGDIILSIPYTWGDLFVPFLHEGGRACSEIAGVPGSGVFTGTVWSYPRVVAKARVEPRVKRCSVETQLWRRKVAHLMDHFSQASLHMAPQRSSSSHWQYIRAVLVTSMCVCMYIQNILSFSLLSTPTPTAASWRSERQWALGHSTKDDVDSVLGVQKTHSWEASFGLDLHYNPQSLSSSAYRAPPAPSHTKPGHRSCWEPSLLECSFAFGSVNEGICTLTGRKFLGKN